MANYKDWISQIDVEIDYFSAFLKAYIAFNSWYKEQYPNMTDRLVIDIIKDTDNVFKRYIINLISTSTNYDNVVYQENLGKLHGALCNSVITTQEFGGVRKMISFSEIAIKNTNNHESHTYRNVKYTVKRERGIYKSEIKDGSGLMLFNEEQDKYDFTELSAKTSFQGLSLTRKEQFKLCYSRIEPYITTSVLFTCDNRGTNDENVKKIGAYEFVKDDALLSKAIIEIIYLLRCSLAHGDIAPDRNANTVYKHAYELLAMTLKKMI